MKKHVIATALLTLGLTALTALQAGAKEKVAGIYSSNITNPFDATTHAAIQKAAKENGFEYEYIESVAPGNFERMLRQYGEEGCDLIVSSMGGHHKTARRVARDYPEMAILAVSETEPQEPNFSGFGAWLEEGAYLCGMVAGMMTKTDVIGVVGEFPVPDT